jgi:hypothetical protein
MMIRVNKEISFEIGRIIGTYRIRPDFSERTFLSFTTDRETRLRAFFYAVAICHQTHHFHFPMKNLFGWEVIEEVFSGMMKTNHSLLGPDALPELSQDDMIAELSALFSETGDRARTTFDRPEERATLLIDLENHIQLYHGGEYDAFIKSCNSRLLNEHTGWYPGLSMTKAFGDPLFKKTSFLVKLLLDGKLISIEDPEHFVPIMDYHMQRVLLRTGCVEVAGSLRNDLIMKNVTNQEPAIRSACIESMRIIAQESGHPIWTMNDFFWPLGRSCCHVNPICTGHQCEKNPCTLFTVADMKIHERCILENICKGRFSSDYRSLWQPVIQTHYY